MGPPEVVEIREVPKPQPKPGEVLVRVEAVAVTAADSRMRAARFPPGFGLIARPVIGFRGPRVKILGSCISGTVEAVGEGVTQFVAGDEVAGMTGAKMRAHAQYAAVAEGSLVRKPEKVSHADAAGVLFGGTTALYFLRDQGQLKAGESVLVNGASGAVGSAVVQIARHLRARVTAVASAKNQDFLGRIGAHEAIDYQATPPEAIKERFDVVLDAVGTVGGDTGTALLTEQGRLLLVAAGFADTLRAMLAGGGKVFAGVSPERREDFALLLDLVADGKIDAVTEVAGGLDALPEAHRIVDSGRKVGNLVILPPSLEIKQLLLLIVRGEGARERVQLLGVRPRIDDAPDRPVA